MTACAVCTVPLDDTRRWLLRPRNLPTWSAVLGDRPPSETVLEYERVEVHEACESTQRQHWQNESLAEEIVSAIAPLFVQHTGIPQTVSRIIAQHRARWEDS